MTLNARNCVTSNVNPTSDVIRRKELQATSVVGSKLGSNVDHVAAAENRSDSRRHVRPDSRKRGLNHQIAIVDDRSCSALDEVGRICQRMLHSNDAAVTESNSKCAKIFWIERQVCSTLDGGTKCNPPLALQTAEQCEITGVRLCSGKYP